MGNPVFSNIFEGLDPIFAAEVMDALGMSREQLHDTRYPALLSKAVRFLKSEPNWRLTVAKVLHGKPMAEPLRVMAEYADLRAALASTQARLTEAAEKAEKLRLVVDPAHPESLAAQDEVEAAQRELEGVYAEVRIYEK